MPYFITNEHPECSTWATVKGDGELISCHTNKQEAVDQMVVMSLQEELEPGGTYTGSFRSASEQDEQRAAPGTLKIGNFVSWDSSGGRARGQIEEIVEDGVINVPDSNFEVTGTAVDPAALIRVFERVEEGWRETDTLVGHKFSTLTSIEDLQIAEEDDEDEREVRQVNLTPPAYMRAAARQGLRYYEEGKGGDGLVERTIREARAMAAGNVTADKWVRIRAWIARHLVDLDSSSARPSSADYPSAGVVAHLLWGSGPSKRAAQRALTYAEGVVSRIEAENEGRAKGEALSKIETRVNNTKFEVREVSEGMRFSGYAAVFNSPSEPLPFTEQIAPGAFRKSLRARNDIKFLWNHDTGEILGSTRAGTLSLKEDKYGLRVEGLLPQTTRGRDVAELLRRGDVDAMSFGFSVPQGGDSWSADGSQRTLNSVRLLEVSLVAMPAYSATAGTVGVRGIDKVATRAEVDADQLADALLKIEDGQEITAEEKDILSRVLDELSPKNEEPAEEAPDVSEGMLALKKKKLQLLLDRI
jgi:HK97 family phage prohead protease